MADYVLQIVKRTKRFALWAGLAEDLGRLLGWGGLVWVWFFVSFSFCCLGVMLDFIVDKVLFWLLICLLGLEFYNLVFHRGVPNIRTAPALRARMIALIKEDFEKRGKRPYTIVDLGSGNGLLTREIARALPEAKVIGIEIARTSVFWSNWLRRLCGLKNLSYLRQDFLTYDFSEADAVTIYLLPWFMKQLSSKFQDETRSGTLILANKFPLYDAWKACVETEKVQTLYFHQGDLHVYRKA